jgi:thiosulfate/3-mercaptopyruvate sulfurtransferase
MTPFLIDATTARRQVANLVFLEVAPWRVMADGPDPVDGSIPGAVSTSIKNDFAGTPTATSGHLPLPSPDDLYALGIRPNDDIVVYTRRTEELSSATRAWFTLTWAGFPAVRVLDGGLPAWVGSGGKTARLPVDRPTERSGRPGESPASPDLRVLSSADVLEISQYGTLLDARPAAAYNGFTDDPRSGHVPYAVHAPSSELIAPDGRLRPATDLRKWFLHRRAIGSQQVGAYCGGGVSSSLVVFAAALIAQPIGLYVDSWSAWSANNSLPVEQGTLLTHSPLLDTDCT